MKNNTPFLFVSGACKFPIVVNGTEQQFRGFFAGKYQTPADCGVSGDDDFKVFHGTLFDELGEFQGTVKWTKKEFSEFVIYTK